MVMFAWEDGWGPKERGGAKGEVRSEESVVGLIGRVSRRGIFYRWRVMMRGG